MATVCPNCRAQIITGEQGDGEDDGDDDDGDDNDSEDNGDEDDGDDDDNCQTTATEEETGVAAWVSAAVLCAFGDNHHNDHDNHHRNHDDSDDELL